MTASTDVSIILCGVVLSWNEAEFAARHWLL